MLKNKQDNRIKLEEAFRPLRRGEALSLEDVAEILCVDCGQPGQHSQSLGYSIARRAAKFIESETNGHIVIRWDGEKNEWRALLKEEIPDESQKSLKQINRKAKAGARFCQAALTDGLEGSGRDRTMVNMTLLNAIQVFSSRNLVKKTHKMVPQIGVNNVSVESAIDIIAGRK